MEFLKSAFGFLAYAALAISLAAAYLKINKIWKRKHNAEVANSVSIAGNVLDVIPLIVFALNYVLIAQWQGFIRSTIWVVAGLILIMIGSGFWVQASRHKSTWMRLKEALRLERSEVAHLATTFFRPSGAEIILEILAHFAYIDHELADSERTMIQAFADNWRLKLDWQEFERLKDQERPISLVQARDSVERYLKTSPPENQVAQLIDVLNALINADNIIADEENIIMEEVNAQLLGYIGDDDQRPGFTVVIAPQDQKQDTAIATLLPHARKADVAGGSGYVVGTYFTRTYAEEICNQYRSLGFFTVDMVGGQQQEA